MEEDTGTDEIVACQVRLMDVYGSHRLWCLFPMAHVKNSVARAVASLGSNRYVQECLSNGYCRKHQAPVDVPLCFLLVILIYDVIS